MSGKKSGPSTKIVNSFDVCDSCSRKIKERSVTLTYRLEKGKSQVSHCPICHIQLEDTVGDELCHGSIKYNVSVKNMGIGKSLWIIILIAVIGVVLCYNLMAHNSRNLDTKNKFNLAAEIKKIEEKYPKQSDLLWQNVRKVISAPYDSVESFVLLYRGSGAGSAECFAKSLIEIINKKLNKKGVVIYENSNETVDYGVELERYLKLMERSNHLVVPKLHEINGETARMFHTLCDVSHSIRPSYIIFTLEDTSDKITTNFQMESSYQRVGHILRYVWSNLLENELHPLISRIVRNVAEISEVNVSC